MWLEEKIHAPEVGRQWINSPAATLAGLRGRVVLVDFWDYTCVNCLRTIPYLKEWNRRYRGHGLSIIGVHAPEFHFARTARNVERAVKELGIEYPVVLDNDYQIWQAYSNRCWPAKYLIDAKGYVRYCHLGEGAYRESEEAIHSLLKEIAAADHFPAPMEALRDTDRPGARCSPVTPELYLGFGRGRLGNDGGYAANEVKDYHAGSEPTGAVAWLDGPWFAGSESIEACPIEDLPARLIVAYRAAEVNLVMSPPEDGVGLISLTLDGSPLRDPEAGEDVHSRDGQSLVAVSEPRMYRLVKHDRVESRRLEVTALTSGVSLYAFTFVSCVE
ncbi:MAG: redoxin family protein [Terriglobia bacterium]